MLVMSLTYTSVTQSKLCWIFLMYEATIQHLNYSGQECKEQFRGHDYDKHVTLKQGQGHQIWYELVDPKTKLYKDCLQYY